MNDYRRVYVVGDVHGNYDDLCTVLAWFRDDKYDARIDALAFVGDLVDSRDAKGEVARAVKHVRELEKSEDVYVVRGNHEQFMIDAQNEPLYSPDFQVWWTQGGQNTYESYLREYNYEPDTLSNKLDIPKQMLSDIKWMESLPTLVEFEDYYVVHAGLEPDKPAFATSETNRMWIRKAFEKSEYDWGKLVIHGHTPHALPEVRPNRMNIDTSRFGRVTGVRLQNGKEPLFFDRYGTYDLREETSR